MVGTLFIGAWTGEYQLFYAHMMIFCLGYKSLEVQTTICTITRNTAQSRPVLSFTF